MKGGQNQVTCQGGFNRDLGCFRVADFTHQDDVGVLAKHRPQDAGIPHPDVLLDGDLDDSVEVVFDRILDR